MTASNVGQTVRQLFPTRSFRCYQLLTNHNNCRDARPHAKQASSTVPVSSYCEQLIRCQNKSDIGRHHSSHTWFSASSTPWGGEIRRPLHLLQNRKYINIFTNFLKYFFIKCNYFDLIISVLPVTWIVRYTHINMKLYYSVVK